MNELEHLVKANIDGQAPINFDALYEVIKENGPLRLSRPNMPYTVTIDIQPCLCADQGCKEMLVPIWRRHGMFTMHWLLSREDLEQYPNLDAVLDAAIGARIIDSRGERLLIEAQVYAAFGKPYSEAPNLNCYCGVCAEKAGDKSLSLHMLLAQLAALLSERDEVIECNNEDDAQFVSDVFDLGFAAGRMFSELSVKRSIEPAAIEGRQAAQIRAKRAKAAGDRSSQDREARRTQLLETMEALLSQNPALARLKPTDVASLAADDAQRDAPALWAQGKGQIGEYLGEIRRGEAGDEMKARFLAMFPQKTLKHSRL